MKFLSSRIGLHDFGRAMAELKLDPALPRDVRARMVMDHLMRIEAEEVIDPAAAAAIRFSRALHGRRRR